MQNDSPEGTTDALYIKIIDVLGPYPVNHFLKMFIMFILGERVHMQAGEGQRGRRERILSILHAVSTEHHTELNPMNYEITTLAEIKSWMLN